MSQFKMGESQSYTAEEKKRILEQSKKYDARESFESGDLDEVGLTGETLKEMLKQNNHDE